jgi:hypothetical protein
MTTTTDPRNRIASLLAKHAPHHGPAWMIGPRYQEARRDVIEAATGKHTNLNKSGINAMMHALYQVFPVPTYTCQADREKQLHEQIKSYA